MGVVWSLLTGEQAFFTLDSSEEYNTENSSTPLALAGQNVSFAGSGAHALDPEQITSAVELLARQRLFEELDLTGSSGEVDHQSEGELNLFLPSSLCRYIAFYSPTSGNFIPG